MQTLSDEQRLLLELIADNRVPALPELARYTAMLAAAQLIELTPQAQWRLTPFGEAMLAPRGRWLH